MSELPSPGEPIPSLFLSSEARVAAGRGRVGHSPAEMSAGLAGAWHALGMGGSNMFFPNAVMRKDSHIGTLGCLE